jgi:hypothetical protein
MEGRASRGKSRTHLWPVIVGRVLAVKRSGISSLGGGVGRASIDLRQPHELCPTERARSRGIWKMLLFAASRCAQGQGRTADTRIFRGTRATWTTRVLSNLAELRNPRSNENTPNRGFLGKRLGNQIHQRWKRTPSGKLSPMRSVRRRRRGDGTSWWRWPRVLSTRPSRATSPPSRPRVHDGTARGRLDMNRPGTLAGARVRRRMIP